MAGAGVWWSIQPFLLDEDVNPKADPAQRADQQRVSEGTARAFEFGRSLGMRMVFGTDILFNAAEGGASQGRQIAKLARFMPPFESLRMATGNAGEPLAMSGGRAPYFAPLGVIAPGAHADLLVIDGDRESGLDWLGDPEASLRLIMKGGTIVKETPA